MTLTEETKDTVLLCLKIHNITNSCLLLRQYNNGVWSFPLIEIAEGVDPYYYIGEALGQVSKTADFRLLSAICVLNITQQDKDTGEIYKSIIYEINYKGSISPELPTELKGGFKKSKWTPIEALKKIEPLNYPTCAFVDILKEKECMK